MFHLLMRFRFGGIKIFTILSFSVSYPSAVSQGIYRNGTPGIRSELTIFKSRLSPFSAINPVSYLLAARVIFPVSGFVGKECQNRSGIKKGLRGFFLLCPQYRSNTV
jgi:hypothetical protein